MPHALNAEGVRRPAADVCRGCPGFNDSPWRRNVPLINERRKQRALDWPKTWRRGETGARVWPDRRATGDTCPAQENFGEAWKLELDRLMQRLDCANRPPCHSSRCWLTRQPRAGRNLEQPCRVADAHLEDGLSSLEKGATHGPDAARGRGASDRAPDQDARQIVRPGGIGGQTFGLEVRTGAGNHRRETGDDRAPTPTR